MILMRVHTLEIVMFAVQKKSLIRRPLEPAETKWRCKLIRSFFAVINLAHRRVEKWMVGMPELRPSNRRRGLVKNHGRSGGNGLRGRSARDRFSVRIKNVGL